MKWPTNGTTVCRKHGAAAPQVRDKAAANVEELAVRAACDKLGLSREMDPGEGLLELVREAAGNVEFYRQLVAEIPTHPEDDELTVDEDGPHYKHGAIGIYGRTYHQSGIPTGEAKRHILVTMYDDERDRFANFCQLALRAGVEERAVKLAEQTGQLIAQVLRATVADPELGLSPEVQEVAARVLSRHLRALPSGA